jgi:hypothetical protein
MAAEQTGDSKKGLLYSLIVGTVIAAAIITYMQHMTARIVSKNTEINNTMYSAVLTQYALDTSPQKTETLLSIYQNGITAQEYRQYFRDTKQRISATIAAKMFKRHDPENSEEQVARAIITQQFDTVTHKFFKQEINHSSYLTLLGVAQTSKDARHDLHAAMKDNVITLDEFSKLKPHHNTPILFSYFNEPDTVTDYTKVKQLLRQHLSKAVI